MAGGGGDVYYVLLNREQGSPNTGMALSMQQQDALPYRMDTNASLFQVDRLADSQTLSK